MQRLVLFHAFPPRPASGTKTLQTLDLNLALANAGDRRKLARKLFDSILVSLSKDLDAINAASSNIDELKSFVHRWYGTVSHCGIPRFTKAIEKLELALTYGKNSEI